MVIYTIQLNFVLNNKIRRNLIEKLLGTFYITISIKLIFYFGLYAGTESVPDTAG